MRDTSYIASILFTRKNLHAYARKSTVNYNSGELEIHENKIFPAFS